MVDVHVEAGPTVLYDDPDSNATRTISVTRDPFTPVEFAREGTLSAVKRKIAGFLLGEDEAFLSERKINETYATGKWKAIPGGRQYIVGSPDADHVTITKFRDKAKGERTINVVYSKYGPLVPREVIGDRTVEPH